MCYHSPYSSVCVPATRLLHPQRLFFPPFFLFYCLFCCVVEYLGGHLGGEVWIYSNNYCSLATLGNAFTALFWFISLLCSGLSLCFVRYCLAPGHVWSDNPSPFDSRTHKPACHRMLALTMHVNKPSHSKLISFPVGACTYSHSHSLPLTSPIS